MNEFCLVGGTVLTPYQQHFVDLHVKNGRLHILDSQQVKSVKTLEQIDVSGCFVTPGLIDLQVNGTAACSLWAQPNEHQFGQLCRELLEAGVTAFLPTLITNSLEQMKKSIGFLKSMGAGSPDQMSPLIRPWPNRISIAQKLASPAIRMPGIHLEGPFISVDRPGVHPKQFIQNATQAALDELISPEIKFVTLAPEQEGGELAIRFLKDRGITVSLGHSSATFAEAQVAFVRGVTVITHTFNALPPIHQRQPGAVVAALLDKSVLCCVICDGLHVDAHMVDLLLRLKGADQVILVTDLAPIGTSSGGLNGSSIMLAEAIRNVVAWKVASFQEAVVMATANPARAINMQDKLGLIKDTGLADLVVWNKDNLAIKHVVARGQLIF